MRYHIRWMIRRDMPEVISIESADNEYAWNEEEFLQCLRKRNCIGIVAEQLDQVCGFMIYELHKAKLHVINLKADKALGSVAEEGSPAQECFNAMIDKLVAKLSSHRRTAITFEVRETNLDLQIALKKKGFFAISVERESFEDSGEDGYLFRLKLGVSEAQKVGVLEGE